MRSAAFQARAVVYLEAQAVARDLTTVRFFLQCCRRGDLRSGKHMVEVRSLLGLALMVKTKFYYVYKISA